MMTNLLLTPGSSSRQSCWAQCEPSTLSLSDLCHSLPDPFQPEQHKMFDKYLVKGQSTRCFLTKKCKTIFGMKVIIFNVNNKHLSFVSVEFFFWCNCNKIFVIIYLIRYHDGVGIGRRSGGQRQQQVQPHGCLCRQGLRLLQARGLAAQIHPSVG